MTVVLDEERVRNSMTRAHRDRPLWRKLRRGRGKRRKIDSNSRTKKRTDERWHSLSAWDTAYINGAAPGCMCTANSMHT